MSKEFLSTRQVSEMVSLSLGTVQKMVDEGEFVFFITRGGHRRILASSVKAYLLKRKKEMGV